MRFIFIRHGDPDYSIDSLTQKGVREAKLLGERVKTWNEPISSSGYFAQVFQD